MCIVWRWWVVWGRVCDDIKLLDWLIDWLNCHYNIKTGHWITNDNTSWLWPFFPNQAREFIYYTLIQFSLPLFKFNYVFHKSWTQTNLSTNLTHCHITQSHLQWELVKSLIVKCQYSVLHVIYENALVLVS